MKSFIRTATACAALVATALALVRADEPSDVLTLTQDTFQSTIDATPVIMVEFYAPCMVASSAQSGVRGVVCLI